MKKHGLLSILVVISMLLAFVPTASAQVPIGDWVSGITCQNLDTVNPATIIISFYPQGSGTSVLDYYDTIAAGSSKNYYTPSSPPGLPSDFLGSAVIASSSPLSCSVNTQTTGTGTTTAPFRISTSAGFGDSATSNKMFAPQVMKTLAGAWSSYIAVQNVTPDPITVTLTYKNNLGVQVPEATESVSIPGYSNKIFYQAANLGLPAGFLGAATIDATGAIAVTVNFYNAGTTAGTSQFHSYNGFASGSTKLLVPRFVRRFYGYNSGLTVQNVGLNPTTMTIVFTFDGVNYTHTTPLIQPGAAYAVYATAITALTPVDSLISAKRTGSAVITASEPIIAIVNEDNRGNTSDNNGQPVPAERIGQGSTYNTFVDGSQTTKIFFTQIVKNASVFSGGFQVANTTNTAGSCTATFNSVNPVLTYNFNLGANGSASIYAPNVPGLPYTYNGSVTVTCNVNVIGIYNLAVIVGTGGLGDSFMTGNGLNR